MNTKRNESCDAIEALMNSAVESPLSPSPSPSPALPGTGNLTTREAWLNELMYRLSYYMEEKQADSAANIADWRVSCGWPYASKKAIGQCFPTTFSKNGKTEMFISPKLDIGLEVAATLLHEMVHASVGCKEKHNRVFGKLARKLGLEGRLTATFAGADLKVVIEGILAELPEYPHAGLGNGDSGIKKQTTRMVKCACAECGYIIRTTQKWLDVGVPVCVCGGEFTLSS